MKTTLAMLALLTSLSGAFAAAEPRPNILLILADDLGWSDLGCYGSEIQTPRLDALANDGLRFTRFYNGARCCPSRASVMTGLYPHQAGFPHMSGSLPDYCVTIPEALRAAGYRTFMVGKWHLGKPGPIQRGFEEYYGMLGGFNSFWREEGIYSRLPADRSKRSYAPGAFYSTDAFADYALDFIGKARSEKKPWFLYLAFNAPHFPLHAPEADITKYETVYQQGWDRIRERRLARQKELGLVPRDLALPPRSIIPPNRVATPNGWANKQNPAWDSLDADRRADLARRMAVYAAMVDHMDRAIGRVVDDLRAGGDLDNTLLIFLSDNGACAEWDPFGFDRDSGPENILHRGADLKTVGGPDSYISYGSAWANACNTPWTLYKHYSHEGGISTPLIVHWPAGMKRKGETDPRIGHIIDLLPTCIDAAGAPYPQSHGGTPVLPMEGQSFLPTLRGERQAERTLFFAHEGNRAVRSGDWKLVALEGQPWQLFNVSEDRVEQHDLAPSQKQRVDEMAALWTEWSKRVNKKAANAAP